MKSGVRALGFAESYRDEHSTVAGAVVRADRVIDGLAFGTCTVGGTDATGTIETIFRRLDREDVRYCLVAGIAPAWYNLVDLHRLADSLAMPVVSVSFEASPGLEPALREAFDGDALERRLETYRAQPDRTGITLGDGDGEGDPEADLYLRSVGIDDEEAAAVVRAFTPEGGRPEPLRVARLAARGGDEFRRSLQSGAASLGADE